MSVLFPAREGDAAARELHRRLVEDRVLLDPSDPLALALVVREVERIADDMDRKDRPPPMLWTGIPFPRPPRDLTTEYCLVVSVGGTKTSYALLRLERGVVHILDQEGREVRGSETENGVFVAAVKKSLRFPTPGQRETRSGLLMIDAIVEGMSPYLEVHRGRLERCHNILLSWGFANRVVRTGPHVLGGVAARTTLMTKDQAAFTADLEGKDIGGLFRTAFERRLGWSRPVTAANDGVMALHYFLTAENMATHARFGLFINGTGTNFAAAEPYAVRPEGVVSAPGEEYEPERITRYRPLRDGERLERFIVNYETGSILLEATRTPYDQPSEYPIEENALSGGSAFGRQFRAILTARVSEKAHRSLLAAWRKAGGGEAPAGPGGPEVARIASEGARALEDVFPEAGLDPGEEACVILVCRAIVARSALHAALILAAVTRRLGFGLGEGGRPDLLALEGSVWSGAGYATLVRSAWQALVGARPLAVDFVHEKSYDASLPGPLYLAAIQA